MVQKLYTMETIAMRKTPEQSMFKAMSRALAPTEKELAKQSALLIGIAKSGKKTAEDKMESKKAEKLKKKEE